jgi:hypothetical protein
MFYRTLGWSAITRETIYVSRNIEAVSRNYFCRVKSVSIIYSNFMSVAFYPACKAHASYSIVICGLSVCLYRILLLYFINCVIFGKKILNVWRVFWFSVKLCLHVLYPVFLSDFNKYHVFSTDFWKNLKYKISSISCLWEPSCSLWTYKQREKRTHSHDEAKSSFS